MYIRIFHLVNRNGVQQTSLDPTIDEFYYDGSTYYRTLLLNGVYGKAQITLDLRYDCDRGFCGSRCEKSCQEELTNHTNTNYIDPLSTNNTSTDLNSNAQQISSRESWSTENIIIIVAIVVTLVVDVLVFIILLIVILTIAYKLKGK